MICHILNAMGQLLSIVQIAFFTRAVIRLNIQTLLASGDFKPKIRSISPDANNTRFYKSSSTSSYNQVVFVENPRFFTWYISVRRASVMDIS